MRTAVFDSSGKRIGTVRGKNDRVMRFIETLRKRGITGEISALTLPKQPKESHGNYLFEGMGFGIHKFCTDWEYFKVTGLDKDYLYEEEINQLLRE
jgi:hypothetical protein